MSNAPHVRVGPDAVAESAAATERLSVRRGKVGGTAQFGCLGGLTGDLPECRSRSTRAPCGRDRCRPERSRSAPPRCRAVARGRRVQALELHVDDVLDAGDLLHAPLDLAGVQRLPEGPGVGVEERHAAVGREAGRELLLQHEVAGPRASVRRRRRGARRYDQRDELGRPDLEVLADEPHRLELVGDCSAQLLGERPRCRPGRW